MLFPRREQVEREIQQPSILRQKAEHAVTSAAFRALQQQPSAFTPSPLQQPNTYTANGVGPSSLQGQRAQPTQQGATEPRYQMASTLPSSDVIEREQAKAHRADRQVEVSEVHVCRPRQWYLAQVAMCMRRRWQRSIGRGPPCTEDPP